MRSPHVLHSSLNPTRELPVFQNDLEPLIFLLPPFECWHHPVQLVNPILLHVGTPRVCTVFEFSHISFEIFDPWRGSSDQLPGSTTHLP